MLPMSIPGTSSFDDRLNHAAADALAILLNLLRDAETAPAEQRRIAALILATHSRHGRARRLAPPDDLDPAPPNPTPPAGDQTPPPGDLPTAPEPAPPPHDCAPELALTSQDRQPECALISQDRGPESAPISDNCEPKSAALADDRAPEPAATSPDLASDSPALSHRGEPDAATPAAPIPPDLGPSPTPTGAHSIAIDPSSPPSEPAPIAIEPPSGSTSTQTSPTQIELSCTPEPGSATPTVSSVQATKPSTRAGSAPPTPLTPLEREHRRLQQLAKHATDLAAFPPRRADALKIARTIPPEFLTPALYKLLARSGILPPARR